MTYWIDEYEQTNDWWFGAFFMIRFDRNEKWGTNSLLCVYIAIKIRNWLGNDQDSNSKRCVRNYEFVPAMKPILYRLSSCFSAHWFLPNFPSLDQDRSKFQVYLANYVSILKVFTFYPSASTKYFRSTFSEILLFRQTQIENFLRILQEVSWSTRFNSWPDWLWKGDFNSSGLLSLPFSPTWTIGKHDMIHFL